MSSRKKTQPTDDEIEADVLAKRGEPAGWDVLPFVPPSTSPRPGWMLHRKHLEVAAKFHVLSALHRFGLEANLALAQPDNVDIAVLGPGRAMTIDVKIVEGAREWVVDHFTPRKHHYIVVVAFAHDKDGKVAPPTAYVLASRTLQTFISRRKIQKISLDTLAGELAALEAWPLIIAQHAA